MNFIQYIYYFNKRLFIITLLLFGACKMEKKYLNQTILLMKERQITYSPKNHALDNNDNFSADGKFLCYDTRGSVGKNDLAHTKTIEKVEISSGEETVLWNPESVTSAGGQAAPGVAAVSWHPSQDRVVFIHGPFIEEVQERGYYGKKNRTAVEVIADGSMQMIKVDKRDVNIEYPTIPGAHRGGTHRHEYSRDGKRIGFTYDDFLLQQYDRTIGYMEASEQAPKGYTHYLALLVKPAEKGKSVPGQIEKAWDDSWLDAEGKKRAFVARIRSENGVDYDQDLCVAEIPDSVDVSTANAGTADTYPKPPKGIVIHRLTYNGKVSGIVRGSYDGKQIAYFKEDENSIKQVFLIEADGSDRAEEEARKPGQITHFTSDAIYVRWHPSNDWLFCINEGNVIAVYVNRDENFGQTFRLTNDTRIRSQLVVSADGKQLAYDIRTETKDENGNIITDVEEKNFMQIFILQLESNKLYKALSNKT